MVVQVAQLLRHTPTQPVAAPKNPSLHVAQMLEVEVVQVLQEPEGAPAVQGARISDGASSRTAITITFISIIKLWPSCLNTSHRLFSEKICIPS